MSDPALFERAMRRVAEQRLREAMRADGFRNLKGQGEPIPDLELPHDQWWNGWWRKRVNGMNIGKGLRSRR